MFNKGPIFLNVDDILNISDTNLNLNLNNEKTTKNNNEIKLSLEEKLLNDNIKEQIEISKKQEQTKTDVKLQTSKYPGDDIPWIF